MALGEITIVASTRPIPFTSFHVRGYKSLRDRHVFALAPLTLLAGRNSAGKSSAMQPLLLLKQTLQSTFDAGALRLDGPFTQFSASAPLFWHGAPGATEKSKHRFEVGFRCDEASGQPVAEMILVFEGAPDGIRLVEQRFLLQEGARTWKGAIREGMSARSLERALELPGAVVSLFGSAQVAGATVVRRGPFLTLSASPGAILMPPPAPLSSMVRADLDRLLYLPGLRGNPERAYPGMPGEVAELRASFGPFHPYTAGLIATWQEKKDARLGMLGEQLAHLGLTWKAQAKRLDATRIEVQVGRLPRRNNGSADLVNIADVGIGVSQTLPLLVALLQAQPGQIVYVEQPEIHLHPAAQLALAGCLIDAAKRGVRVVAETHSNLLLEGVLTAVANGTCDPGLVKLYWFERDDDGATQVAASDVDEHGTFGDWPVDFGEVELDSADRYLRASMGPVRAPSEPRQGTKRERAKKGAKRSARPTTAKRDGRTR